MKGGRGAAPRRILVATSNPGKLREIRDILADRGIEFSILADGPGVHFPEEGDSYTKNAEAKARAAASQRGEWALADDSGLEVGALGGRPGPHSARYGGPELDDAGRAAALLKELEGVPEAQRKASFVCVAALATPEGEVQSAQGECRGVILKTPRGISGFGYDPIFQLEGRPQTMAEIPTTEKNQLSHRAKALQALFNKLQPKTATSRSHDYQT